VNAVYARQSLDKKDSLSIETQIELSKAELGDEPVKLYIDKGFSGKNANRPDFRRMMADVKQGLIKKVVVYKLDRLSRSLLDFAEMIEIFKKYDVDFVSTREKFDTSMPIGNAMLSIIMVFAQLERETIQIRVQDSYYSRSAKGAYDCVAPYGYSKCKADFNGKPISTLEVDEYSSEIIRNIFEAYAYTSTSLGYLSRQLNERKIPTPRGVEWDSCKLSRIMANPVYVKADADVYQYYKTTEIKITNPIVDFMGVNGCVTYGKWDHMRRKFAQLSDLTLSIGLHKGIVDADTFLRCQYKLNDNAQIDNSSRGKHSWLTGFIKCGYCGKAMKVTFSAKAPEDKKFVCSGATNYGTCVESSRISIGVIEGTIEYEIFKHIKLRKDLVLYAAQQDDAIEKQFKMDIARIELQIENLIQALADGNTVTMSYINSKIVELEVQKTEVVKKQQRHQLSKASELQLKQFGDILIMWAEMTVEQKHDVGKMLIDTVRVFEGNIQIEWKYNFAL
jgi:DNA invertase Pin-like site-specific DNA recombinase